MHRSPTRSLSSCSSWPTLAARVGPMVLSAPHTRRFNWLGHPSSGGGRIAAAVGLAWSITVGGGLVDLSALSTVGALFLAAAPPGTNMRALFNALLVVGVVDIGGRRSALLSPVRIAHARDRDRPSAYWTADSRCSMRGNASRTTSPTICRLRALTWARSSCAVCQTG